MTTMLEVPVSQIWFGSNVRDEEPDTRLVESIRQHGVLQPITVRTEGARYVVVMGFRRLAAAKRLGLTKIPAVVDDGSQADEILRQLAENVDRKPMNPIDVARALHAHLEAHPGLTKAELAASCGRPGRGGQVWIANKLALLRLDDAMIARIESGEVNEAVAIKARQRLGDGRGRPRAIPLPEGEVARSRSVSVPLGRSYGTPGTADVSIDLEGMGSVDVALHVGERGLFLTLSADEARLLGRRILQAGDALRAVAS